MAIDRFGEYCYPIGLTFNIDNIKKSIYELLDRLHITQDYFFTELQQVSGTTMNLTHLPYLQGTDRWKKFRGNHLSVISQNVNESDFTHFLEEMNGLYLKDAIDQVFNDHFLKYGTKFQGRCQLIWLRPKHTYAIHTDSNTVHRYHIPVYTDEDCLFIFKKDKEHHVLHMPANGNVWYLNPKDVEHTVAHMGSQIRLHILLTSEK